MFYICHLKLNDYTVRKGFTDFQQKNTWRRELQTSLLHFFFYTFPTIHQFPFSACQICHGEWPESVLNVWPESDGLEKLTVPLDFLAFITSCLLCWVRLSLKHLITHRESTCLKGAWLVFGMECLTSWVAGFLIDGIVEQ